jgi:nucleotide-binding universal stress UspA family protein
MYRKILIANDGSEGAARALEVAIELANQLGTELHMISVEEMPRFPTTIDEVTEEKAASNHALERVIEHARSQASADEVELQIHVVAGHAVPTIVEFVEREKFELLVVGYMGHSALYNRLIGSTTDRLVELAPCAVLVVKLCLDTGATSYRNWVLCRCRFQ